MELDNFYIINEKGCINAEKIKVTDKTEKSIKVKFLDRNQQPEQRCVYEEFLKRYHILEHLKPKI